MKALHARYRSYKGASFDANTNYVFVLERACDATLAGEMPRRSQFGYLFTGTAGADAYRVFAHELGHGRFTLEHSFDGIYANVSEAPNLMNYGAKQTTDLARYQWDILHDPAWLTAFDKDEDGMSDVVKINDLIKWVKENNGKYITDFQSNKYFQYHAIWEKAVEAAIGTDRNK